MAEPFKNMFSKHFVHNLSNAIYLYDKSFSKESFEKAVLDQLEALELKQRMRLISTSIDNYWTKSYQDKVDVLLKVKNNLDKNNDFVLVSMVFPDFVEVYGLDDYDISIKALETFTIDSSSEFAIRPFIIKYEKQTMNQLLEWTGHKNEHVRRLCSEGCRPRLPWAIALPSFKKDPTLILPILEQLKNDKSEYVRKSVANNLNDISKDNPKVVIEFIKNNVNQNKNLDWVLKHGARTLLKASNSEVLSLFGYSNKNIKLDKLEYKNEVKIGDNLPFSFQVNSEQNLGKVRLEYAIDLLRKNGKYNRKVFQISTGNYEQKSKQVLSKHSFRKVTTRNYYVGLHKLLILVNGLTLAQFEFDLIEE